jgi:hypothetical protein
MNKKRQTSHLFLLSAIVIIGATSLSAGQIFQQGTAQVGKPNTAGVANQTAANIPYLPPGLMQSIIDQARNTNATKFAFHNAINATSAALNKTAGMNATGAAGMNKTAGMNATGAAGMNKTAGMNATGAAGMNKTAGMNATGAAGMNKTAGMNATGAPGMNKTAGMNATGAAGMNKNLVQNTNATKFAAHNIINATENTTSKH